MTRPADQATVPSCIRRLNPADGLFLRGEHLRVMQDYARDLAYAVGLAGGTGVVHGFTVTLQAEAQVLEVAPGLAVDPVGRPLRACEPSRVPLTDPPGPNGFWVLEVVPACWLDGSENVYGNLCDDPCGAGSAIAPWEVLGVTVRLRADSLDGLDDGYSSVTRRNRLASLYFERERERGEPWLTPPGRGLPVPLLTSHAWSEGTAEPAPGGVPLAVVARSGTDWVLDVWTARRDLGDPPSRRAWQGRLSMRPWEVFIAQVLQFQAQYASVATAGPAQLADRTKKLDEVITAVEDALRRVRPTAKPTPAAIALGASHDFVLGLREEDTRSLAAQGFDELPPAGFLRADPHSGGWRERLTALFGEHVELRFCHCRADYVAQAVTAAQHLDRIPLVRVRGKRVKVDILVPDQLADLEPLYTAGYDWVAFVRRAERGCEHEERTEPVGVYWLRDQLPAGDIAAGRFEDGGLAGVADRAPSEKQRLGFLHYPVDSWEFPGGKLAGELVGRIGGELLVVALVRDGTRLPLGSLRASLFADSLDSGLVAVRVFAVESTFARAEHEAIVVFGGRRAVDQPADHAAPAHP